MTGQKKRLIEKVTSIRETGIGDHFVVVFIFFSFGSSYFLPYEIYRIFWTNLYDSDCRGWPVHADHQRGG